MVKNSIFRRTVFYINAEYHYFLDSFKSDERILEDHFNTFIKDTKKVQSSIADSIIAMHQTEIDRNADEDKLLRVEILVKDMAAKLRNDTRHDDLKTEIVLRELLVQQITLEETISDTDKVLAQQRESVDMLKQELLRLEKKKNELVLKKDSLQSRAKSADAMLNIQKTLSSTNLDGLSTKLNSLEKRVRSREYTVSANKEISELSSDSVLETLAQAEMEETISSRMAQLTKNVNSDTYGKKEHGILAKA